MDIAKTLNLCCVKRGGQTNCKLNVNEMIFTMHWHLKQFLSYLKKLEKDDN